MIYIFLYNVVSIKSDFTKLKAACTNAKFILIASGYCLKDLSTKNYCCFDAVHKISRNFHSIDYDFTKQIIDNYVKEYDADSIRLMTNEDSTQVVLAKLREFYGIYGERVNDILPFVNKPLSKLKLSDVVKKPKYLLFNKLVYNERKDSYLVEILEQLSFPLFIKPVNLVSSLYTYKINDFSELKNIINKIIGSEYEFEIDEFIDGDLFHCDIIMDKGEIKFFAAGKYAFPLAKFAKGFPMGSIPVADQKLYSNLNSFTNKVIKKLDCKNGAYHIEVFLEAQSKELIFLEAAARTPGALLPMAYEIQFGVNMEELHYLAHMDLLSDFEAPHLQKMTGWITFPKIQGTVLRIEDPDIDVQYQFIQYVSIGDTIEQAHSLLDASCSLVFWDFHSENIQRTFEILKDYRPIKVGKFADPSRRVTYPELDLEKHFEILEELFNGLPYVFWKNRQGRYLGCNLNQAKAFSFNSISEFVGKTIYEILSDVESARLIEKTDDEIMDNGQVIILEEPLQTPEGIKTFLSQKQPIYNDNGAVIGLLGFSMDITQLKEQERLAIQERKEFRTAIGQMLHDIQSPLSSLSTIVAEQSSHLPEATRITLRNATNRIGDITNNMFKKYENKDVLETESISLLVHLALLQVLSEKRYEYSNSDVDFEIIVESRANFVFIKINPSDFKRMVSNIINNAVEALKDKPDGKVQIELDIAQNKAVVFIRDNGHGMPQHIVDKFYQGIAVTEGKDNGHGLGLSQVRETVANYGGKCKIYVTENTGTEIVFWFPLVRTPEWIAAEIKLTIDDTVVVLDDDHSIHDAWRNKFKSILEQFPTLQMKYFTHGKEAISYINSLNDEEKEDIFLLTDFELLNQGMNGLDVVKAVDIRRALLVTSHASSPEIQEKVLQSEIRAIPKELNHAVSILVDKKIPKYSRKVDMVWVEDQREFVDDMVREYYGHIKVDVYYEPNGFMADAHQYALDTRFILDTNYYAEDGDPYLLDGFAIAKRLHEMGYTKLILFAGEVVKAEKIPPYLTVVLKNDLERRKNLDKI